MLAAVGCHSTRPTLRAWLTSSFLKAVRFLVSSCLGMSQILICQERYGPRGVLAGVPSHPDNPEQQHWHCPAEGPGQVSLYLPVIQWRGSWGSSEGRGFPKVLQPKQGLEMSPGFWEPVPS